MCPHMPHQSVGHSPVIAVGALTLEAIRVHLNFVMCQSTRCDTYKVTSGLVTFLHHLLMDSPVVNIEVVLSWILLWTFGTIDEQGCAIWKLSFTTGSQFFSQVLYFKVHPIMKY